MPAPPWRRGTVLALGIVSLLTDASSEMIMPLLPVFLTGTLGAGALWLGVVEGAAEGVASALKLWSGRLADRTGKNRPLVIAGYTLSSIVRPLMALAATAPHVLAVRVVDRVGKGLRTSPRDALLAGSVPPEHQGAAFGFHRAMDHAGAVVGPLLAFAVLTLWTTDLRVVFALAAIPAAGAVAAAIIGVREVDAQSKPSPGPAPPASPALRRALLPLTLFAAARVGDTFLILRAGTADTALSTLPLLWMGMHLIKSATAGYGGRLADRIGPRRALALGWLVAALTFGALALAEDPRVVGALVLSAGLYQGLSEPASGALVATLTPGGKRGGAFGLYHLCTGLAGIAAGLWVGGAWDQAGPSLPFSVAAGASALAAAILLARR